MKRPMMTGDTLSTVVAWHWRGSYWDALLQDGSELRVSVNRRKGGSIWHARVLGCWSRGWSHSIGGPHASSDAAKQAAFDWYMSKRCTGYEPASRVSTNCRHCGGAPGEHR